MKIALVSKADAKGGGAGRVADDIQQGLAPHREFAAARYVGHFGPSLDPAIYRPISTRYSGLRHYLKRVAMAAGYVDHFPIEMLGLNPEIMQADIVHFHDLSSVFAPRGLLWIGRRRPVVWTLHDESPLTAGCIYPLECRRYLRDCGRCPQLGEWPLLTRRDRTSAMARVRRRVLDAGRMRLVAPSEWMRKKIQVKHPSARVDVIYNGVDTSLFAPTEARLRFVGREPDTPTMTALFVANYSREVRKGSLYIPEIVDWLKDTNRTLRLVVVGETPRKGLEELGPLQMLYMGHIGSKQRLARLYASVDAVLMLSHADNCPLVVLEALSCGAPVIAFGTGGIPELVDEASGVVCTPGALDDLLAQLFARAEKGELPGMSLAARAHAEERFSMSRFIEEHVALYERVAGATGT